MRVKDIETERLWDEMKRRNPSLYDFEQHAAQKKEARKTEHILREMEYAEPLGDDYPPEVDFVKLDMEESDSSPCVDPDEDWFYEEEDWYENKIADAWMEDDFGIYWDGNGHSDNKSDSGYVTPGSYNDTSDFYTNLD